MAGCNAAEKEAEGMEANSPAVEASQPDAEAGSDELTTDTSAPDARGVTELTWEDLMPEGEEARLEELYAEFYRDFEARMMQQQSTLSSTLSSDDDLDMSLIPEGSDLDTMTQIGTYNVVEDLDGKRVRLPGYIVPLDFSAEGEHNEFLLVPYFGACLHSPPPPPNQIIFVTANPPAKIPDIYDPVWLEGTLTTGQFDSKLGNSAYELSLSLLEPYEY